jgi:nucleotide-binding universal stress UspA family protein
MRTIDTVLVPLDGSAFSRTAVPAATRLATRLDAAIHLLSAVESVDEAGNREADLAHVEVPGRRVTRTVVVDRDPARAIHETLRRMPAGVACMATHGRARSTALIGSVATDVVARGHDIVLVCPYIDQARRTADVVVCVDDSPASAGLVMVGLDWADRLGERLVVLTVAEEVQPPATDERPQCGSYSGVWRPPSSATAMCRYSWCPAPTTTRHADVAGCHSRSSWMSSNQCPHAWRIPRSGHPPPTRARRPPDRTLRRFGEAAALRRSNGTKAASFLAPGRCRRPRIVADR